MKYKVLRFFNDLQDNEYYYETGSVYPRDGLNPSQNRIDELASANNKQAIPLIEPIADKPKLTKKRVR